MAKRYGSGSYNTTLCSHENTSAMLTITFDVEQDVTHDPDPQVANEDRAISIIGLCLWTKRPDGGLDYAPLGCWASGHIPTWLYCYLTDRYAEEIYAAEWDEDRGDEIDFDTWGEN